MELSTIERVLAGEIPASPDEKQRLIISIKREKREADRNVSQLLFNERMELAHVKSAESCKKAVEYKQFAAANAEVRKRYEERSQKCEKALKILGA